MSKTFVTNTFIYTSHFLLKLKTWVTKFENSFSSICDNQKICEHTLLLRSTVLVTLTLLGGGARKFATEDIQVAGASSTPVRDRSSGEKSKTSERTRRTSCRLSSGVAQ